MIRRLYLVIAYILLAIPFSVNGQETYEKVGAKLVGKLRQGQFASPSTFDRQSLATPTQGELKKQFRALDVYQVNISSLHELLGAIEGRKRLALALGDQDLLPIELEPHDLRADTYTASSSQHGRIAPPSSTVTFRGKLNRPGGGEVRLSLSKDKFMGFVEQDGEKIFLESLGNLVEGTHKDIIVSYRASALTDSAFACAVTQAEAYSEEIRNQVDARAVCSNGYELEIATIATFERYLSQGASVSATNDHILGLLNLVEPNYAEFKVNFKVVEQQVVDCDNCEPWGAYNGIQELLSKFSGWAPGGFVNRHDVGICFFRGPGSGTVGYAWVGTVCVNSYRYSVVDLLGSATSNRVLIAHELGHNFGAGHDASGAPYIMAPSINSSTTFSSNSITSINNHISSRTCLSCVEAPSPCTNPVASVDKTDALCDNEQGSISISFDNLSGPNTFEFSLNGGNTYPYSASDNDGSIMLDEIDPGTYQVRVRVQNTTCVTDLGPVTVNRRGFPNLMVGYTPPTCGLADGKIGLSLLDADEQEGLEVSLDSGMTYPYIFGDDTDSLEITGLKEGKYEIWVRWEDGQCPVSLGSTELIETSSFAVCDDQDPLTTDDRFDESCRCVGLLKPASTQVKVLLEGFYSPDSGTMRLDLNSRGLIPLSQPFSGNPYNYAGGEQVPTIADSIVDWVLIELRDSLDLNTLVAQKAVLLSQSGYVVDTAGNSQLTFDNIPTGHYYVAVHHPGHLAIVTPLPIDMSSAVLYDFSLAETQARGAGQLKLIGTLYCMFAGDFDSSGIMNNLDYNLWRQDPSVINQYLPTDVDGNGIINNLDYNLWRSNGSKLGDEALRLP